MVGKTAYICAFRRLFASCRGIATAQTVIYRFSRANIPTIIPTNSLCGHTVVAAPPAGCGCSPNTYNVASVPNWPLLPAALKHMQSFTIRFREWKLNYPQFHLDRIMDAWIPLNLGPLVLEQLCSASSRPCHAPPKFVCHILSALFRVRLFEKAGAAARIGLVFDSLDK